MAQYPYRTQITMPPELNAWLVERAKKLGVPKTKAARIILETAMIRERGQRYEQEQAQNSGG